MEETIFVQIAAYRDPELIHTVRDCIAKASKPSNLRFCIGWQHSSDEKIDEILALPNVLVLDIPHTQTKGACWIRRMIQNTYNNETYTLQLDSHHRFTQDWDLQLIDMYKGLLADGVKKPLLTAYLTAYILKGDTCVKEEQPWEINYDRFLPEGPIFLRPSTLKNFTTLTKPVPARGLSAHFIFTQGSWCKEVPYDPELYFHGEEISLAVRSYTHGYDLYTPNKIIIWHQYTRAGVKKHWDDHTNWGNLNALSYKRVKILLGIGGEDRKQIDFKECGTGTERTIEQFERYAGVEFKTRRLHDITIAEIAPPVNFTTEEKFQSELHSRFKYYIDVYRPDLPDLDYDFWCVVFKDGNDKDIYRNDADKNEIQRIMTASPDDKFLHILREFECPVRPHKWLIWPHSVSKGWETKIIQNNITYS